MNIKLIANGSSLRDFCTGHWGLSILIDKTILFDCFASYSLLKRKMHKHLIDPDQIKDIVISHEHWDHIDGLWGFLKEHKNINVYLPSHTSQKTIDRVIKLGGVVKNASGKCSIKQHVHITNDLIGIYQKTPIAEQGIVLETQHGLILLVGCAHPGINAFIQKSQQTFQKNVYGVIGGLHLLRESNEKIQQEALAIKNEGIKKIAPLHCSGKKALKIFKLIFQEKCIDLQEGEELVFE